MHTPTVELARELIRIESVTPDDNGCQDILCSRLESAGFSCERMVFRDVKNLWARRGDSSPLLVFAGHTDVVPTGPLEEWTHAPFSGIIEKGMLHGRGAADMKGSIACFAVACERFVSRHPRHGGSVALLITSDEEGIARWGTRAVMEELDKRNTRIDLCLVGEPSSTSTCGDTIKVGRRGSLNGCLTIHGKQGHIAYPHLAENPLHHALGPLDDLVNTKWDLGNEHFQPTSFQISNIRGGTGASNVIPGHVEIQFNFRYSPETDDEQLRGTVHRILNRHEALEYDIAWGEPSCPFYTPNGRLEAVVKQSIRRITGLCPESATTGGTSDGRFIAPSGAEVVELGPVNATIHQINEQVSIRDLELLTDIYEDIIESVLNGPDSTRAERPASDMTA